MLPGGTQPACVVVAGERISAIATYAGVPQDAELRDYGDSHILPGLVDTHIHINEPGRTHWEGFETATRAAAAGGYTCLVDMPLNSIPATTTVSALEEKRAAAQGKCWVDYAFWGGAVAGNAAEIAPLARAGVRGFKAFLVPSGVDEFTMLDEAGLCDAMPLIAKTGLPLLAHAELPQHLVDVKGDYRQYQTYLQSRPDSAELEAIRLLIRLGDKYGCRVHVVHLATASALNDLRGKPLTVETCPHYLYFSAEAIPDGATQFKCAPPIRSRSQREGLWQALRDGLIHMIATDHSPCPPEMKQGDFKTAWGGISSVSLALPAVWTQARTRGFEMHDLVRWMSEKPAELAGILTRKGRIAIGHDADLVVFSAETEWTVAASDLYFKNKVTPYLGERLTGKVQATYLRGELTESPRGREVTP